MKIRFVKGMASVLCMAMLASAAAAVAPGSGMTVLAAPDGEVTNPSGSQNNTQSNIQNSKETKVEVEDKKYAVAVLNAYKISLRPNADQAVKIDKILAEAYQQIGYNNAESGDKAYNEMECKFASKQELDAYVEVEKKEMDKIMSGSTGTGSTGTTVSGDDDEDDDDSNDDNNEDPIINPDHFLMVGGSWVTPVANAGSTVSIVLPVVNMGKTMVTDAVVTPVLSTDTTAWPFEITNSNYSQRIDDLPGTDTGMNDMDRRRELTWELKTRSDVGSGYQKLSFDVRYRDSDGESQTTTLDTYIQLKGTAGVGADGKSSVPRVIVTGFETNPETVHAGESFMLTLHLKNTSTATSVNNMMFEIEAAVEGKDEETTYAAFLPTAGSSTIFVDRMEKNGTKDIQIELEAKADLSQKPYALDVNMSYEDEHVNAYTSTSSVSIPVKQEARVDISQPEVMPSSISVGSEANIMFNIYNMGKTKLYNVQVKTEGDTVSGGDAFVGNLDSGATGAVDMYVTGQSATMDDGVIKLQISYEDEAGESTSIEKEISLFVSEAMMDDGMMDDGMMDEGMMEEEGNTGNYYIAVVIIVLLAAAAAAVAVFMKRKKKKEQMSLEDDIMDLDDDDTDV